MRLRTGYSFRAAVGGIPEVISRVREVGWDVAPITDRASTFGWARWKKAALKEGLRPVFGVELAVAESVEERKPTVDYWTFLAFDEVGPINRLVELATEQFRYQPLLTYEQAQDGAGVAFMAAAGRRAKLDLITNEGVFYGVEPGTAKGHLRRAREKGMTLIASGDNLFPRPEDQGLYETIVGRNASTQTYDQFIQSDEQWKASASRLGLSEGELERALAERRRAWGVSIAGLRRAELVHPPRPKPLREMCIDGAKKLGVDLSDPVYSARLDRELDLIAAKEFEDYFYLVSDICRWARKRMAVGPARGSSCGSLACYLLEITTVDPIPFGLIFERFIDINRSDLPDIDIDFPDTRRDEVFQYMKEVYGPERVARLGAVAMYKAKSALSEAGAALQIPLRSIDRIGESLIQRSSGDSRAMDTIEDTIRMTEVGRKVLADSPEILVASKMEGHPRHYTQHAAGVVVASEPIENFVAVDHRTGAAMCDKKDAEDEFNLLKIDALGLTQLSVLDEATEAAGLPRGFLEKLPIDDPGAFSTLNNGSFSGVFQWNGGALRALTKQITVDRFEDIVAISALARPGPLATGGSSEWVRKRMGEGGSKSLHPMLDELTKETFGVVVYQEQVMKIAREMGRLSWEDTSDLRKAMSKSLGDEFFAKYKERFIKGAGENGVDPETAGKIWDQINTFGSWAFNKSHAVAYGYISYWCCWMKAHHPFEFAAATLNHETDPGRQIELLREMKAEGIGYVPVDLETSQERWVAAKVRGERVLVGPLTNVKGIGPKMARTILRSRENGQPLTKGAQKLLASPKTDIDSLYPIRDRINEIMPDPLERNIVSTPVEIGKVDSSFGDRTVLIIGVAEKINLRDKNEMQKVEERGGRRIEDGPTAYLQLRMLDDTGAILTSIPVNKFERLGREVIARGRAGKAIWAVKGRVFSPGQDFTMIVAESIRYVGDMDPDYVEEEREERGNVEKVE